MQLAFYLTLAALAVYRVSHMLAYEEGPFAIFAVGRSRLKTGARVPEWLKEGAECPMCISFYLGFLAALPLLFWGEGLLLYVVASLALSGVTVLLVSLTES